MQTYIPNICSIIKKEASSDYQFEDYYYMARTICSGALRLYSFMETFHVTEDSAGNVEMKSPMGTGTIRWVSDTEFILPLAGYDFLCHAVSNPEQKIERIQMMSTEFLPISKETVFCQYLSIGLALLAGVYCLLMFVKNLLAGIFRRRHFQGIPFGMEALTAGFFLSLFQYVDILTPGTALLSQVKMHGILYLAYLFMGLFYLFWVFLSHRKSRLEGWLTAGAVVLVGGFILYWQLFVWWI